MQLKDEKGASISLEDLKGKVVFINFWATWCSPCIAEMPTIQSLYENFKNDDEVKFVILEVDGNQEKAKNYFNDKDLLFLYHSPMELYLRSLQRNFTYYSDFR